MAQYRLFFFDGRGRIKKAHEFEADHDEAAIKISVSLRDGRRMELWGRDTRVKRWVSAKRERLIADRDRLRRFLEQCTLVPPDGLNDAEFGQMIMAVRARIDSLDAEIAASGEPKADI